MKTRYILLALAGAVLLLGVGAGGIIYSIKRVYFSPVTKREVVEHYRSRIQEKHQEFIALAKKLPPPGALKTPMHASLPKPTDQARTRRAAILLESVLLDPTVLLLGENDFPLEIGNHFHSSLRWTSSRLHDVQLDNPADPLGPGNKELPESLKFSHQFESALKCEYLVILRPIHFVSPKFIRYRQPTPEDSSTISFSPGEVTLEAFVFDLGKSELVAFTIVRGQTDPKVQIVGNPPDMNYRLRTDGWQNLRRDLSKALSTCTDGGIVIS